MNPLKEAIQKPEVNFWLGIIIPIIALAVAWGSLNTRLDNLDFQRTEGHNAYRQHVIDSENRFDAQDVAFTQIQVRLAELQKDISFIRERVK